MHFYGALMRVPDQVNMQVFTKYKAAAKPSCLPCVRGLKNAFISGDSNLAKYFLHPHLYVYSKTFSA